MYNQSQSCFKCPNDVTSIRDISENVTVKAEFEKEKDLDLIYGGRG